MIVSEARTLLKAKILTKATVSRVYKDGTPIGWSLKFEANKDISEYSLLLETQQRSDRLFRSSDAAIETCKKIGFYEVTVLYPD
jgi:hypothetical protein